MDKQLQIVKEIGKTPEEQVLITNVTIGEGAFSQVYIAFYKKEFFEKKEKATKLCAKILQISNPTQLPYKQIQTEQQIMMSIQSPYVLRLLQFHQTINNIYFILEYCEDGDLTKLLKNNELNEGQVLYLFGKFPWEIQQIETHQKLIDVIKNTTNIHFSNNFSISEDTKDLIKNMLEVEEANRFEWEEIINMNIIKESYKEEYKSQIIQMIKNYK
ncbi:hypothetical protein ABPG72_004055 [Tetrahymena utriculariae]